jgi:hypothetical protein
MAGAKLHPVRPVGAWWQGFQIFATGIRLISMVAVPASPLGVAARERELL